MGAILELMREGAAFNPQDIGAMSMVLDDVCKTLSLDRHQDRRVIAIRIIELARRGERSPTKLRDRLLAEANTELDPSPLRPAFGSR
jgi:hypothetical protein